MGKIREFLSRKKCLYPLKRLLGRINMMIILAKKGPRYGRKYVVLDDKKLLYLENSKVACSSIKASMLNIPKQECYNAVHGVAMNMPEYRANIPYGKYTDYYRFTFVRNPFARLVSCYINKYKNEVHEEGKNYFANIHYLGDRLSEDNGFTDFAKRVCRIPQFLADRHFVSQSYLIHDWLGRALVDHVFLFENIGEDYGRIADNYNLSPLPMYNKTPSYNWIDYYDMETAELVYRYYRRDIKEFGYQADYEKLTDAIRKRT